MRIEKYTQGSSAATKHETSERKTDDTKLWKFRGGGRSKRLGVATLSGLLAVGLTPAFVTPAFAGATGVKGDVSTPSAPKITVPLTISGADADTAWTDTLFKAHFKAGTGNAASCPAAPGDKEITKQGTEYKAESATIDLSNLANSKDCEYEVSLAEGSAYDNKWSKDPNTVTVKFSKDGSGTLSAASTPDGKAFTSAYSKPAAPATTQLVQDDSGTVTLNGKYENTVKGNPAAKFTDAYQVEVKAATDNKADCSGLKKDPSDTEYSVGQAVYPYAVGGTNQEGTLKLADVLKFTKAVDGCKYEIRQVEKPQAENAPELDRTGWTPDKHVYTLTLKATGSGSGVSVAKDGKLQVSEDGVKPATDATPEELRFANKYESDWKIRFLKAGTVAANSSADAYAKVKAVDTLQVKDQGEIDKAKLPTTVGKYCEDPSKPVLLGWKKVTTPTGGTASLAGALEDDFAGNVAADADYEAVCGTPAKAAVSATNTVTIDNVVKNTADNDVKKALEGTNFTAQLVLQTTSDTTGEQLADAAKCPDPQQLENKAEFTKKIENSGVITFPDMVFNQLATCVYKVVENGEAPNWDKITPETPQITITVKRKTSNDGLIATQNPAAASARLESVAPVKVTFQATDTTFGKAPATTTQVLIYGKAGAKGLVQAAKQAESQLNIPAGKKLAGWSETGSLPLVDLTKEIFKANSQGLYRPVWGTDATVKFYKEGVKEPVTTQTLVTGQPVKNTGDNGVKLDDASKFCANPTDQVTGWHQKDAKPGVYVETGKITGGNTEYTAHCVTPQVTFKGGSDNADATKNGSFKQGEDSVGAIKVNVAGLAAPTVAKPTHADEKNKSFAGWVLTRTGDPLDNTVFAADLSNTIPASTPAVKYEPRNGDVLTAHWAYTATFQKKIDDTKGETIGYEFVGSSALDGTELTNGKSVKTERLCPAGQVATGKWQTVTTEDGAEKLGEAKTLVRVAVNADTVYRADCSKATNKIEFHVNGGKVDGKTVTGARFLDSVVEDVNHESLNADKTVLTVTKDVFTGYQAPTNEQVVYKGHQLKTNAWMKGSHVFGPASTMNGDDYVAQWQKATTARVKVTFNNSTDPGVVLAQQWVEYNAGFTPVDTSKACVDKTKPVFDHWENADSKKVDETTPLQGNATLKAVCKEGPTTPVVTFDANGGKFADGVNPVVEIKDGKVEFAAVPKLEGKVFAGWCTEKPGEDGKCAEGKEFKNEGLKDSVTVYASYAPSFKVTFDLNGGKFAEGVASEAQTDKDGKVAKPADPTLDGKVFSKWCVVPAEGELDEAKCVDFDFAKAIDKDTTLKAVYKTAVTVKLQPGIKDAKAVEKPVAEGSKVKDLDTTGMCAEGFDFSKWDADGEATVEAGKTYTATCVAHVDMVKVTVKVGTETKSVEVVKGSKLTLEALKTAGVTCGEGQALKLTKADGTVFSLDTAISEAIELTAKCEAKTTPGGSTGGSTGGSSSGGSYFGGGSFGGGSSTPSTPAKDKKPGDKKPGAKQPVVNKFDKQFTKKVELPKSAVKRAAGADRVATSVAALSLAKNHEVVVLATGSNFPDALVGGALAGAYKAGVVLTTGATLEQSVLDSLKSYKTKTVHIVGGNGAVSLAKEAQLRAAGLEVIRHAGADRYATAQAVKAATLKALGGKSAISCNATGSNFPDALACSSAASQMGGVVDLVKPGTAVAKDATAKTVCAGGPACQAAGAGVDKVVGSDRYETAYKLAEMTPAKGSVLVSNGQSYADSLVAGALAGSLQADLVLAKPSRVNVPAGTKSAQLFGGTTVLPDSLSMYTK